MNQLFPSRFLISGFLILAGIAYSCEKKQEYSFDNPPENNKPPIAVAGPDTTLVLPEQHFLLLDGKRSKDPENRLSLTKSSWTKLSGPALKSTTENQREATMSMEFITAGQYSFEFTAKDYWGASAKDTIIVSLKWAGNCNPNKETIGNTTNLISTSPDSITQAASITSSGSKICFAGGLYREAFWEGDINLYSDQVHIFDIASGKWTKFKMTEAKSRITMISAGNLFILAGGRGSFGLSKKVDIIDPTNNSITSTELSVARSGMATTVVGNKVFFAGGFDQNNIASNIVDIYDMSTGLWTVDRLSEPRGYLSAVSLGDKAFFMGGAFSTTGSASGKIDIYDQSTGQWDVHSLIDKRIFPELSTINNNVVIAGGIADLKDDKSTIKSLEFFDPVTKSIKEECLTAGYYSYYYGYNVSGNNLRIGLSKDQLLYYMGEDEISIYDQSNKSWKLSALPQGFNNVLFAINNSIYTILFVPEGNQSYGEYQVFKVTF